MIKITLHLIFLRKLERVLIAFESLVPSINEWIKISYKVATEQVVLEESLSKVLNTDLLFNTHGLIPELLWQQIGLPRFAFSKSSVRYSFIHILSLKSHVNSDIIAVKVAHRNPPIYLFLWPLLNEPNWAATGSLVKHSGTLAIRSLILLAEQTWLALFQSLGRSQVKHLPCISISLI